MQMQNKEWTGISLRLFRADGNIDSASCERACEAARDGLRAAMRADSG